MKWRSPSKLKYYCTKNLVNIKTLWNAKKGVDQHFEADGHNILWLNAKGLKVWIEERNLFPTTTISISKFFNYRIV